MSHLRPPIELIQCCSCSYSFTSKQTKAAQKRPFLLPRRGNTLITRTNLFDSTQQHID